MDQVEESIDLTPGDVWSEAQIEVVKSLAFHVYRVESALARVIKIVNEDTWGETDPLEHRDRIRAAIRG
jgi:hypothetical protein